MSTTFYPPIEDISNTALVGRLELLRDAAEHYKAAVLDPSHISTELAEKGKKRATPRDLAYAFNWQEIAKALHEIRDMPEGSTPNKNNKSDMLRKLAEVYEVLRAARMPKLEAVRLALMTEANNMSL